MTSMCEVHIQKNVTLLFMAHIKGQKKLLHKYRTPFQRYMEFYYLQNVYDNR